jgi:hypothetical protein
MSQTPAQQIPLFEAETPETVSPARASNARKAVFANLATLRRASRAAVVAPQFAEWEAGFLKLCELLPKAEAEEARAALAAEIARLRAAA